MADVKKIATRDSYGNALKELGAEHDDLIVFDADLAGATKTGTFQKAFPERHFDCGIAEGNMIAVAAGAAAMDLCACVDAPVEVAPRALVSIPTGIAIALPSAEYVALVFARSGLGIKHGIALSNGVGVIDSDYRGEIGVGLVNLSGTPYTVAPGDRIAQLAVVPVVRAALTPVEELDETARGAGGFPQKEGIRR